MNTPASAGLDSIRRNTLFALGIQLSGALFTGAMTLALVRLLGPDDYGIFALAVGVGIVLLLPSDFGVSQAAARFIAERRDDDSRIGAILGDAVTMKLVASGLASAALAALAEPIATAYGTDELAWPLRLVALAVLGQSFMGLFTTVFEALGRNSFGFRLAVSESATEAGVSVALVLLGGGVVGATAGRAIGFCFGGLLGFVLARSLLGAGRVRLGTEPAFGFRRIASYAGPLFIIAGAWGLLTQIDILLIGAMLSTTAAGLFAAPVQLMVFIHYPGHALASGVAPRLAGTAEDPSRRGLRSAVRGFLAPRREPPDPTALQAAMRLLLLIQFLMMALLLTWATPLVQHLLGSDYAESADVVRALAPYVLLSGFAALLAIAVNYLGEARRRVPIAIAALAVNAAIDVLLIPQIGIVAGAIGTDVATALYVGGHWWICRRIVRIDLRRLGATAARSALAALVACAILFAIGTGSVAVPALIAGGLAATAAYGGVLIATREISLAEVDRARSEAMMFIRPRSE